MSEQEKKDIETICEIRKNLPEYLQGKLDGYAEAIREQRISQDKGDA